MMQNDAKSMNLLQELMSKILVESFVSCQENYWKTRRLTRDKIVSS